jgi:hypothetical protein
LSGQLKNSECQAFILQLLLKRKRQKRKQSNDQAGQKSKGAWRAGFKAGAGDQKWAKLGNSV